MAVVAFTSGVTAAAALNDASIAAGYTPSASLGPGDLVVAILANWLTGQMTPTGGTITGNTIIAGNLSVGVAAAKNLVVAGGGAAIATTATAGFLFLSTCAGTPTGTPASIPTGTVPFVFDTSGVKLWGYTGGAWKGVVIA